MPKQHTCDCCKRSVQSINEAGLCFACGTFQKFATTIKNRTELSEDEIVDLAGDLSANILSDLIDRLQTPGHAETLLLELLQTLEPRDRSH